MPVSRTSSRESILSRVSGASTVVDVDEIIEATEELNNEIALPVQETGLRSSAVGAQMQSPPDLKPRVTVDTVGTSGRSLRPSASLTGTKIHTNRNNNHDLNGGAQDDDIPALIPATMLVENTANATMASEDMDIVVSGEDSFNNHHRQDEEEGAVLPLVGAAVLPVAGAAVLPVAGAAVGPEKAPSKEGEESTPLTPAVAANEDEESTQRVSFAPSEEQTSISDSKNHERRRLIRYQDEAENDGEDYGYDDEDYGLYRASEMDASHIRLKKRLSTMERLQSKFLAPDETKEKLLPPDTFSFMIISETCGMAFISAITIFFLQVLTFLLVLLDLAAQGEKGNVWGVPANASAQLRTTQFIAVIVAVLTQGDLRAALTLLRDGFTKEFHAAFIHASQWKFRLAIAARALSGTIGLMVVFVLIITSNSVVGLLLDFTAVEFVSSIDELCFFLSKQGFLGTSCKKDAAMVTVTMYKVAPESRQGLLRRSWKTLSLLMILFIFLFGWVSVVGFQLSGRYVCNTIMVNMGDDFVPALGAFNGLYDLEFPSGFVPFKERRAVYVERRSQEIDTPGRGIFGYCGEIKAWTFRWEATDGSEQSSPCDWVAKSSSTTTFDITETLSDPWLVRDATQREVVLDPFVLFCFDCENENQDNSGDCGEKGTCTNGVCSCVDGWYGLRCEFLSPCPGLAIDQRTEEFASTRDWSSEYQTIELDGGSLVEAYHRPVYIHNYDNGQYDAVFFTGRRWALTSSEFLPFNGRITDDQLEDGQVSQGDDVGNFFKHVFHGYQGYFEDYSVAFLSDSMDTTTDRDSSSPVGFNWFRAVAEERTADDENQGIGSEVDSEFLCYACDEEANPCLYDGVCNNGTRECECSIDSEGSLCEIPPVRNGHCDPFFNTPEFKMDGGDCCEQTCVSSQYICGSEAEGYVSTGYFHCLLPRDQWQENTLDGDAGSYAGFSVDLSIRSMAVSELLQDRVRIYDKVGSAWVLRATLEGAPGTRFGISVALSSGPHNVVSNPSFLAPLTVAVHDGARVLRVYKCLYDGCSLSQEFQLVFAFDLSDSGSHLATSALPTDNTPPSVVTVYKADAISSFQSLAQFNITRNSALASVFSLALSGDGSRLAVHSQLAAYDQDLGFFTVTDEYIDVKVWNETSSSYELEAEHRYETDMMNTLNIPLSLGFSPDGRVLAYGTALCRDIQLHVRTRNDNNEWEERAAPLLSAMDSCVDSGRPPKNNNLVLSRDGSTLAFRAGTTTEVFKWESDGWARIGDAFSLTPYPLAISSDGNELAIGAPEDGIGGLTGIYSLPGRQECAPDMALLRVSLTLGRLPEETTWSLKNSKTGEVLFQEGPYTSEYAYATIVEERCVPRDACFEFFVAEAKNRGLQAPGQYAVFLDGEMQANGTFNTLFKRELIGDCSTYCPEGKEPYTMMLVTCGPVKWTLRELIERGYNSTLLNETSTFGMVRDDYVHETCNDARVLNCAPGTTVQVSFNTCLDPSKCYASVLESPNRYTAHVQAQLGSQTADLEEVPACFGIGGAFVGNPDECPLP